MDILGKIFCLIFNNCLWQYADYFEKNPDAQVGLLEVYCTADNIFTLQCLVQQYLSTSGGRFCWLFVDFEKAFNSIYRNFTLHSLI